MIKNIPEDTDTFHYYNANPKDRKAGDCVIRAICTALNQSWEQTLIELTEYSLKSGYVLNEKKCYEKYLADKGLVKQKQPRKNNGTKYTGNEFCKALLHNPTSIIAHIGGHHIVCIKNKKIWDTWNCSNKCIGNYWIIDKVD